MLDVDGDGVLSLYELHHFYEEVLGRLADMNIECLSVEDTICQVIHYQTQCVSCLNYSSVGLHKCVSHYD